MLTSIAADAASSVIGATNTCSSSGAADELADELASLRPAKQSPGHARSMTLADDSDIDLDPDDISHRHSSRPQDAQPTGSTTPDGIIATYALDDAANASPHAAGQPKRDTPLPEGTLTETKVLMSQPQPLAIDRYGFVVSEQSSTSGRCMEQDVAKGRLAARVQKWREMLGPSGAHLRAFMDTKCVKFKRRVRKGIPDEFRGLAWQIMSGGRELLQAHPGEFARLQGEVLPETDIIILRDLDRTFPNHILFMQRQGVGQHALFTVLRAYAAFDREVGYVQGMGFLAAVLLMYMSAEEAFWTLVALMKGTELGDKLEGLYINDMPLLQCCMYQFHSLLAQVAPRVSAHFAEQAVEPVLYSTHWFTTILAYSLPLTTHFQHLLRIWDIYMLEGMKVVFRIGLAILLRAEERLLAASFEDIVEMLSAKNVGSLLPPRPDDLLRVALRVSVSRDLARLREQWIAQNGEQFPGLSSSESASCSQSLVGNSTLSTAAGGGDACHGEGTRAGGSPIKTGCPSSAAGASALAAVALEPGPLGMALLRASLQGAQGMPSMHGGRTSALVATEGGQQQDNDHDIEHGHGHQAALEIQPKEAALACDPRRKEGHHGDLQGVASNGHEVLAAQEEEQELMHDGVGPPLGVCKHTGAGAAAASASGGQLQAVAGLMREKGEQQQQQTQQHIEQKVAQPLQQVH